MPDLLTTNGHALNVIRRGPPNGPAVILLHHGLGSARAWRKQIVPLAAAGWRVVAYDRHGYGRSGEREAFCLPGFEDDQDDLLALMDLLGIPSAVLVGHSDGGTLALNFAARHPQRVTGLVVVAAHIYVEPKMLPGIRGVRYIYEHDPDFLRRFKRVHGAKYHTVFSNWYDGWLNEEHLTWDLRPSLAQIACPVLVVQGVDDEHATPRHAEDTARAIPGAQLWLVAGAGHMLPQDAPEVFNPGLLDFLTTKITVTRGA